MRRQRWRQRQRKERNGRSRFAAKLSTEMLPGATSREIKYRRRRAHGGDELRENASHLRYLAPKRLTPEIAMLLLLTAADVEIEMPYTLPWRRLAA